LRATMSQKSSVPQAISFVSQVLKRDSFALREIAAGANGRALSGLEAQQRAQAVLAERGYTWPMRLTVQRTSNL
jgi:hypothetical protein